MSKQEAKTVLMNQKELKGHELYNITSYDNNQSIIFTSCKGSKCYYGLYDVHGVDLEYAGKRSELQ